MIVTGRNEVVAKVIFLHLSVIHSVHRGVYLVPGGVLSPRRVYLVPGVYLVLGGWCLVWGGCLVQGGRGWCLVRGVLPPKFLFWFFFFLIFFDFFLKFFFDLFLIFFWFWFFIFLGIPPPPQEAESGIWSRATGTHPTGMHSCFRCYFLWKSGSEDIWM